jgi:uncharacterized membrane protein
MKLLRNHPHSVALALCLLVLAVFLASTNPNQLRVGLLVVPVMLMFLAVFVILHMVLSRLKFMARNPRKERVSAMAGASLATILLILQSAGGITTIDLVLLVLLVAIASLYISKY